MAAVLDLTEEYNLNKEMHREKASRDLERRATVACGSASKHTLFEILAIGKPWDREGQVAERT